MSLDKVRTALVDATSDVEALNTSSSGNISSRLNNKHFLVTPSGKNEFSARDTVMVEVGTGQSVDQEHKRASTEKDLHAQIYKVRPDNGAIVHFHSKLTISIAGVSPWPAKVPYAIPLFHTDLWRLGIEGVHRGVPFAAYAHPGSLELAIKVAEIFKGNFIKAAIMERHGAIVLGKDIDEAVQNALLLEHLSDAYLMNVSLARDSGRNQLFFSPEEFDQFRRHVQQIGYVGKL